MGVCPITDLPTVAPGVTFNRKPPKSAPMNLVNLLNVSLAALAILKSNPALKGVSVAVTADWLGDRNWRLSFSATTLKEGVLESSRHFSALCKQAAEAGEGSFGEGLKKNFDLSALKWDPQPGLGGKGIVLNLNCTTNPDVGINPETGKGYWEEAA